MVQPDLEDSITLKVAEALQGEVDYGKVRLDTLTRNELGLSIEDIIEIHGKRRDPTVAIVWRAITKWPLLQTEEERKGIIRVDSLIRNNAKVKLGDKVKVKKAQVKPAQKVVLAPVMDQPERVQFGPGIEEVILKGLNRRPLTKGDVLIVPGLTLMGGRLPFAVTEVQPKGIIQIQADTIIQVHEEPVSRDGTPWKENLAKEREKALDYDSAIELWEELGEIEEAARVRKLKADQGAVKVDQTVVHGDYVDDRDTIVKDSVVSKSSIGSGGSSKVQELKELKEMFDSGFISKEDMEKIKKEILGK